MRKVRKKIYYIINALMAFLWHCITGLKKNDIIIFGAGNGFYENNIAVLHSYVKKKVNYFSKVYFVSDSFDKIKEFISRDEYLKRGSFICYLTAYRAKVLIIDTCNSDVSPGVQKFSTSLVVNVNHGMEGFKKIDEKYYQNFHADIHCAASAVEREIKIESCGADPSKVYITGYPRFDKLEKKQSDNDLTVLLFLTWRPWLENKNKEELILSKYYESITGIINSKEISEVLNRYNAKLVCRLHHKISKMNISSISENVKIVDQQCNLSELIRNSDVLVTDYSSVSWDFLYLEKPVLFYAPDIERYKNEVGLYLDIQNEVLGSFSSNLDKLKNDLEFILKSRENFSVGNKEYFFAYQDKGNCERIMFLIKENI